MDYCITGQYSGSFQSDELQLRSPRTRWAPLTLSRSLILQVFIGLCGQILNINLPCRDVQYTQSASEAVAGMLLRLVYKVQSQEVSSPTEWDCSSGSNLAVRGLKTSCIGA